MASHRVLMVMGLLLLASHLLAQVQGDDHAQHIKDQKASADAKQARPESHSAGWSGGGWGGWGPWGGGGWGGGGRGGGGGGGWGGGGWGGGGWGGGGWGGGGHGGGWGGGGWGCRYRCGYRCCSPQEIAKIEQIEAMNTERMTAEVKPQDAGKEGYGGGGYGGGGWGGGGWGGGGHGGGGWGGGGHGGGGWGGGGHGGSGWGGGCRYWCGRKCCGSPEEMAKFKRDVEMTTESQELNEVKPEGWGGGGCRYWCGRHCCTAAEMASNAEHSRSESETKKKEAVDNKTVKQGEVKN